MNKLSQLEKEYIISVAGEEVSDQEAREFLDGMDETFSIIFDTEDSDGYLISKTQDFPSLRKAMEFGRRQSRKIIIGQINNKNGSNADDNFQGSCKDFT